MKNNFEHTFFSFPSVDVMKASYKDSVYYIAGTNDITEYVMNEKNSYKQFDELSAIENGLKRYFDEHPEYSVLKVPQYELIILNDSVSSFDYVMEILTDLFRKSESEASLIAKFIDENGFYPILVSSFELAHTYQCMIETTNTQTNNNLQTDVLPIHTSSRDDSFELLEKLIRRDHPTDI